MKLHEKLAAIQVELKAPKSQYNSFGKYYYRNVEDILEAAKPLNKKYGVTLYLDDEIVVKGDRHYVLAYATIKDEEESITVRGWARESETKKGMDDSQVTGSTSSYARKYALNGLYAIDDTKDADTDEYVNQQRKAKKKNQRYESDVRDLISDKWAMLVEDLDVNEKNLSKSVCQHFNVGTMKDVPADKLLQYLTALVAKREEQLKKQQEEDF